MKDALKVQGMMLHANVRTQTFTEKTQRSKEAKYTTHNGSIKQRVCCLFLLPLLLFPPVFSLTASLLLPHPPPVDVCLQLVIRWREAECDSVIIHADVCR